MDKIILKLTDVDYDYPLQGKRSFQALNSVSLWVEEGEILGLVGESGSGKSTLAKVMLGISGKIRGEVRFKGIDIHGKSWKKMKAKPIQMGSAGLQVFAESQNDPVPVHGRASCSVRYEREG